MSTGKDISVTQYYATNEITINIVKQDKICNSASMQMKKKLTRFLKYIKILIQQNHKINKGAFMPVKHTRVKNMLKVSFQKPM